MSTRLLEIQNYVQMTSWQAINKLEGAQIVHILPNVCPSHNASAISLMQLTHDAKRWVLMKAYWPTVYE